MRERFDEGSGILILQWINLGRENKRGIDIYAIFYYLVLKSEIIITRLKYI